MRRQANNPEHVSVVITEAEFYAAVRTADSPAVKAGLSRLGGSYSDIWEANPPAELWERERVRWLLQHCVRASTFAGTVPPPQPVPAEVRALQLRLPFASGTRVFCMQGNNTMLEPASHSPSQLAPAIDLNAPPETPIVAAGAGTVYVYDGGREGKPDNYGFGNLIVVDHGNGFCTVYAHVDRATVRTGDRVVAGQAIAVIGKTGPAGPDPQLHFEVARLLRQPDPEREKYQADDFSPNAPEPPFSAVYFELNARDVTAEDASAHPIASHSFRGAEAGALLGYGHVYEAP